MAIKAIETEYNGYKFRSRLEARWAVFFDAAGIKYQYETEGYEIGDGVKYLPDFYLPELETHVEAKGKRPGYEQEILRLPSFIEWGGPIKQILILSDVPGKTTDEGIWHFPAYYWRADHVRAGWWFFQDAGESVTGHISAANYYPPRITEWAYTSKHSEFSIDPKSDNADGMRKNPIIGEYNPWDANPNTAKALSIARKARFEYGETPVMANE